MAETGMDALPEALRAEFAALRAFVDRRIAELSAELHATVEIVDSSESNLSGQLAQLHEQVAQLVAIPAASTRNSGLELEAVVQATEAAANTIMEAAEAIQDWIDRGASDAEALRDLSARVGAIFEACSFQDVTGQRIRRAIQHLQQVEEVLHGLIPGAAAPALAPKLEVKALARTVPGASGADLGQCDIDALLAD